MDSSKWLNYHSKDLMYSFLLFLKSLKLMVISLCKGQSHALFNRLRAAETALQTPMSLIDLMSSKHLPPQMIRAIGLRRFTPPPSPTCHVLCVTCHV